MVYDTAANIINRAATHVGLKAVSDPYGSTDPQFVQLCEFLTTVGEDVLRRYTWGHLAKEATFVSVLGQTTHSLPTDFYGMIDRTLWDRTGPGIGDGPISAPETQYLKATNPASTLSVMFRQQGNDLTFPVALGADLTIAYEYISSYWVAVNGSTTGTKAAPTLYNDVILFDPLLMVRGLKVQWLNAKGMDSSVAVQEFEITLQTAKARNTGGKTLSLSGGRRGTRFLSGLNIPDTGYGSP